jgi:hypothetical protein
MPNRAFLTDAYTSPLRTQHGAAKRERYAATKPAPKQRMRLLDILAK